MISKTSPQSWTSEAQSGCSDPHGSELWSPKLSDPKIRNQNDEIFTCKKTFGDASNVLNHLLQNLHMHVSRSIIAYDAQAEILRSLTISCSFTRAASRVLKPPVTSFFKNKLWNEENSVIFNTKPTFFILSETILPAKVTKGPAIAVYSGKDLSWDTQDVFFWFFILKFCLFAPMFFSIEVQSWTLLWCEAWKVYDVYGRFVYRCAI